jgi:hypothetical protein
MKNYTLLSGFGKKMKVLLLLIFATTIFMGCKKDDDAPPKYTNIKFVNGINEATALDLYIDNQVKQEDIVFGSASQYFEMTEGNHKVEATPSGSNISKVSINQKFDGDAKFSVYAVNTNEGLVVPDTTQVPASNEVWVRYLNIAPSENNASYVIKLEGSTASFDFAVMPYKQKSHFKKYSPATYTFTAINFASQNGWTASTGPVELVGGKVYTLFLTGKGSANTLALKLVE